MGVLDKVVEWVESIYELTLTDLVLGGPGGIANRQAQELSNRTEWLKARARAFRTATNYAHVGDDETQVVSLRGEAGVVLDAISVAPNDKIIEIQGPIRGYEGTPYAVHSMLTHLIPSGAISTPRSLAPQIHAGIIRIAEASPHSPDADPVFTWPAAPATEPKSYVKCIYNDTGMTIFFAASGSLPTDVRNSLRPGEVAYYVRTPTAFRRLGNPGRTLVSSGYADGGGTLVSSGTMLNLYMAPIEVLVGDEIVLYVDAQIGGAAGVFEIGAEIEKGGQLDATACTVTTVAASSVPYAPTLRCIANSTEVNLAVAARKVSGSNATAYVKIRWQVWRGSAR